MAELDTPPLLAHHGYDHALLTGTTVGNAKIEVLPWLTELFGASRAEHMIMNVAIADGETVRTLLSRLAEQHPDFAERAFDIKTGLPSPLVSLFLNERFLELAGGLDASLSDGDSIMMIPAWEGGSPPPSPPPGGHGVPPLRGDD